MASSHFTRLPEIGPLVSSVRAAFGSGKTKPLSWRRQQLEALVRMLTERREQHNAALTADLRASEFMQNIEVSSSIKEAETALASLNDWTKDRSVSAPLLQFPSTAYQHLEPYGVVLIIAPWNYPMSLVYKPLVGAIAAGNAVVIKASEVSSNSDQEICRSVGQYLDSEAIRCVSGGAEETTELLKQRFDYIFYTGNPQVARLVMRAASANLTPVTLELGGKSPVYIDASADLDVTVKRIAWGKFLNAGQTCIAPDYLLVDARIEQEVLRRLRDTVTAFYGRDPRDSADYSRIINVRHTQRIQRLLSSGATVSTGGVVDVDSCYISPTVLTKVDLSAPIMNEEIFGPVLPVIPVDSPQQAIDFINSKEKPLALYIFSRDEAVQQQILANTSSGGACINEVVMHIACPELPFGGVGESGTGGYNGKHTFDLFSHARSVLKKGFNGDAPIRYPPYTPFKLKTLVALDKLKVPPIARWLVLFFFLAVVLRFFQPSL